MSAEPRADQTEVPNEPQDQQSRLTAALARVVAEDARQGAPAEPSDERAEGAGAGPPAAGEAPPAASQEPAPRAEPEIDWRAEALRHRDANARIGQELAELRQARAERDRLAVEAQQLRDAQLRQDLALDARITALRDQAQDQGTRDYYQRALDDRQRERDVAAQRAEAQRQRDEGQRQIDLAAQQRQQQQAAQAAFFQQQAAPLMIDRFVADYTAQVAGEHNADPEALAKAAQRYRARPEFAQRLAQTTGVYDPAFVALGNDLALYLSERAQDLARREERQTEANRQEAVATAPQLPKGGGGGAEPVDLARFRGTGDTMGAYRAMKEAGQL